jgi:hypothetical protein
LAEVLHAASVNVAIARDATVALKPSDKMIPMARAQLAPLAS